MTKTSSTVNTKFAVPTVIFWLLLWFLVSPDFHHAFCFLPVTDLPSRMKQRRLQQRSRADSYHRLSSPPLPLLSSAFVSIRRQRSNSKICGLSQKDFNDALDDNRNDRRRNENCIDLDDNPILATTCHRRSFLSILSLVTTASCISEANAAGTNSDGNNALFRPNPLTNPLLEQIRIWEQAEADNLKYGGELERGDAGNKGQISAYPKLLMPILVYDEELKQIKQMVRENTVQSWSTALAILSQPSYDKVTFKKTFNKYGDNIYYSDPDRANLYLGGGATPKTEQSIAYLLRNDVLTNVESLRAELEYLLKLQQQQPSSSSTESQPISLSSDESTDDLYTYADIAVGAMAKYLAIVPPNELDEARKLLSSLMTKTS